MLLFLDILAKKIIQRDLNKSEFCSNFDIFVDMDKQRFFKVFTKKRAFHRNIYIFVNMTYSNSKLGAFKNMDVLWWVMKVWRVKKHWLRLTESREWHNSTGHSCIRHNVSSLPK